MFHPNVFPIPFQNEMMPTLRVTLRMGCVSHCVTPSRCLEGDSCWRYTLQGQFHVLSRLNLAHDVWRRDSLILPYVLIGTIAESLALEGRETAREKKVKAGASDSLPSKRLPSPPKIPLQLLGLDFILQ